MASMSNGVGLLRSRISQGLMRPVNRASGTIMFGFGVYALSTLFR